MKKLSDKKIFFIYAAILIACYSIALLAAWPGFFCYDAEIECYEVFTFRYSNHHPIIHELLLANTLRLGNKLFGSYNAGITIFCIAQLVVLSLIYSYMITTMKKEGMHPIVGVIIALFMGFSPPIAMFAVCTTKDGLFCGGIVLFTTLIYKYIKKPEVAKTFRFYLLLFAAASMMLFFRNNGVYVLAVFTVILLICFLIKRKENFASKRNVLITIIAGIIFYLAVTETLIAVIPVKRGETKEMFSVPMQQLAYVYSETPDAYDSEDLDTLYSLIPEETLANFNPKCADPIKVNFLEDNFKADPGRYISLWFKTFTKKPGLYFKAFGELTEGYWNPFTVITGYEGNKIKETVYGECAYFQYTIENPGEAAPIFKGLNSFYREVSLNADLHRLPVIGFILAPATWIWLFIIAFVLCIIKKKIRNALPYLVTFLTFCTVLLGPIALVRYVLYFLLLLPLIVFDAVNNIKQNKIKN